MKSIYFLGQHPLVEKSPTATDIHMVYDMYQIYIIYLLEMIVSKASFIINLPVI